MVRGFSDLITWEILGPEYVVRGLPSAGHCHRRCAGQASKHLTIHWTLVRRQAHTPTGTICVHVAVPPARPQGRFRRLPRNNVMQKGLSLLHWRGSAAAATAAVCLLLPLPCLLLPLTAAAAVPPAKKLHSLLLPPPPSRRSGCCPTTSCACPPPTALWLACPAWSALAYATAGGPRGSPASPAGTTPCACSVRHATCLAYPASWARGSGSRGEGQAAGGGMALCGGGGGGGVSHCVWGRDHCAGGVSHLCGTVHSEGDGSKSCPAAVFLCCLMLSDV